MINRITIDLGTTNTKVTLWERGIPLLKKFTTPKNINGNQTDFDVNQLWCDLSDTIKSFDRNALKQVSTITFASFGESGVLFDLEQHKPYGECIAWFDERAQEIVDSVSEKEKKRIYEITGLPVHSHYSACKIAWLLKHNNSVDSLKHKYIWLGVPDFLVYKLTGKFATDFTLASRTLCLNLKTKTWSEEVKKILNITPIRFPSLVKSGQAIGKVEGELKNLFKDDCSVAIAGHDHMVGSNSVQLHPHELLDSTGTTEAMMCLVNNPDLSERAFHHALANGIYTNSNHYTRFSAMPSAGSAIEWFMKTFALNENELNKLMNKTFKDYQEHKLLDSNVLIIPHFNGSGAPYKSPFSQGMVYGLNRSTTLEDLLFGLFKGLTYEFTITYESLFSDNNLNKIKVIGPAINDPLWLQLKADTIRLPVFSYDINQAVSAGAYTLTEGSNSLNTKINKYYPTTDNKLIEYNRKECDVYRMNYNFLKNNRL